MRGGGDPLPELKSLVSFPPPRADLVAGLGDLVADSGGGGAATGRAPGWHFLKLFWEAAPRCPLDTGRQRLRKLPGTQAGEQASPPNSTPIC